MWPLIRFTGCVTSCKTSLKVNRLIFHRWRSSPAVNMNHASGLKLFFIHCLSGLFSSLCCIRIISTSCQSLGTRKKIQTFDVKRFLSVKAHFHKWACRAKHEASKVRSGLNPEESLNMELNLAEMKGRVWTCTSTVCVVRCVFTVNYNQTTVLAAANAKATWGYFKFE